MRKAAILFILAVIVPSILLAWVALRSLRDQELIMAKQRDLLYEELVESLAKDVLDIIDQQQVLFGQKVEMLRGNITGNEIEQRFDRYIEKMIPVARTGFVVTMDGRMLSPPLLGEPQARRFRLQYERFLTSKETAQVYWEGPKGPVNLSKLDAESGKKGSPQSAAAEFRELVGDKTHGTVARFVQNELGLLFWYRPPQQPDTVYGMEVHLGKLAEQFANVVNVSSKAAAAEICVALLDENFRPVAESRSEFQTDWRETFVSTDIGDMLPHWKMAVYLLNPGKVDHAAKTLRITLSLLIAVALLSIAAGGWLIFRDVGREVRQARLRSDFVSNVSHELKTPLTSIRMFTELLSEGRVQDSTRAKEYLRIIVSETARLSRLINNVLDFGKLERGEKKYRLERVDFSDVVRQTVEGYLPHLEREGFAVNQNLPTQPLWVEGDRDGLAQIVLNLLSNAEKYSGTKKEISITMSNRGSKTRLCVEDRGRGVPKGFQEKIFEQFFRTQDSLADAVPGAGLGLTLARQIARSHNGEIWYEDREGGGSRFVVELPGKDEDASNRH